MNQEKKEEKPAATGALSFIHPSSFILHPSEVLHPSEEGGWELADETRKPQPFDVGTIHYLVRLMSRYDLSEIDLTEGDQRIRLRRGARVKHVQTVAPTAAVPAPSHASPPAAAPAEEKPARNLLEIRSSVVGTFYAQPKPGAPAYVSVGSRVTPTTVVCIIEAMKVLNEITADCSGVIAEICVKNGEPVEYKTVLFRVDPAG